MVVLLLSLFACTVIYGAMALIGGLPLKLEFKLDLWTTFDWIGMKEIV